MSHVDENTHCFVSVGRIDELLSAILAPVMIDAAEHKEKTEL